MVCAWLVVDALETFKLLQEDRAADARRLEFWLKYKGSIESFHFCLNQQVYDNQSPDYRKFRSKYRELICRFRDAGTAGMRSFSGSAIITSLNFGSAQPIFIRDDAPFRLSQENWVHRSTQGTKANR